MPDQPAREAIKARLQTLTGPARSGGTKDMAALLGMPLHNVHRYVRGPGDPPHDFLLAVADRYRVTLDWLYAREDAGGPSDAEQLEPAWARRMDSRLRFLQSQVDDMKGAARPEWAERLQRTVDVLAATAGVDPVDAQDEAEAQRLVAEALQLVQREQEAAGR